MKKKGIIIIILVALLLAACGVSKESNELTKDIEKQDVSSVEITAPSYKEISPKEGIIDFSLNIFRENYKDENILISPLSIISALGMAANGAENNTLAEMEEVFNADVSTLNNFLEAYIKYIPSDEKYKVNIANSIWIKDEKSLTVSEEFLKTNKTYYDAEVFRAAFDEGTKNEINDWVNKETDGMIDKLLDEVPEAAVMYLINALSFDAEWEKIYEISQVNESEFNSMDGQSQTVDFMNSEESYYLENKNAVGFIKPYKDSKYAFVALLPNEGVDMDEFLDTLDGENLTKLLENKQEAPVLARIPKFSLEYSILLNESLKKIGMIDAFDTNKADFSALANSDLGNIVISRVIHKTKIEVDEKGTKAGAVTGVEMSVTSAIEQEEPKIVYLDRPFFYMIVDTEHNLPIFMGSLMSVE